MLHRPAILTNRLEEKAVPWPIFAYSKERHRLPFRIQDMV
jgi:hypothetical protein